MVKIKVIAMMLLGVLIVSCQSDDDIVNQKTQNQEQQNSKNSYKYEEILTLKDGEYFVKYAIRANDRKYIQEVLSSQPYIKVEKVDDDQMERSTNQSIDQAENIVKDELKEAEQQVSDVCEIVLEDNIPKGYALTISYANTVSPLATRGSSTTYSFSNRTYINEHAVGMRIRYASHPTEVKFSTKHSNWFVPWYWYRTKKVVGAGATTDWSIKTIIYTEYRGIRIMAYTSQPIWNEIIRATTWTN